MQIAVMASTGGSGESTWTEAYLYAVDDSGYAWRLDVDCSNPSLAGRRWEPLPELPAYRGEVGR